LRSHACPPKAVGIAPDTEAATPTGANDSKTISGALNRALPVIQQAAANYPTHRHCFSCHHQTLPMLALVTAKKNHRPIDEKQLNEQAAFSQKSFQGELNGLKSGKGIGGKAMTVGYGLWALRLADWKGDEITEAMVTYLLKTQNEEGYWTGQVVQPPLEESHFTATVLAIQGMKRYATDSQKSSADAAIAKANAWLTSASAKDQEDKVFRLWGLFENRGLRIEDRGSKASLLADPRSSILDLRLSAAREAALAGQQADGGWAQAEGMKSDAYATGQTLFVLREIGFDSGQSAFQRGLKFLLQNQCADGSWFVKTRSRPIQTYFDNGDPHGKDQFISTPATAWAAAALAAGN
jgi:N-acyl-D-amino-acid deacylase